MKEKQKRSMIIQFNDGSKKLLEFPTPVPDSGQPHPPQGGARHLVLEADGALVVIPVESTKYFQSCPAPNKLPAYAIKGVRFKD
jgi:hypothetical protein